MRLVPLCLAALMLLAAACNSDAPGSKATALTTWRIKGGNAEGTQYSGLDEITKDKEKEIMEV